MYTHVRIRNIRKKYFIRATIALILLALINCYLVIEFKHVLDFTGDGVLGSLLRTLIIFCYSFILSFAVYFVSTRLRERAVKKYKRSAEYIQAKLIEDRDMEYIDSLHTNKL